MSHLNSDALRRLMPAATLVVTLGLSACGGEPSEAALQKALQSYHEQSVAQMRELMGRKAADMLNIQPQFQKVKKLGCAKGQESSGYRCDIEVDVGGRAITTYIRVIKADEGWRVTEFPQ